MAEDRPGYHTKGNLNHSLASLCVAVGSDCELSSGFTVRPGWTRVVKHEIDAANSQEFLEMLEVLVLGWQDDAPRCRFHGHNLCQTDGAFTLGLEQAPPPLPS